MSSPPCQFGTWLDVLDHWQTLTAGLVAILAALIAVAAPEFFARCRARKEIKAIRVAVTVEAQWLMDTMIDTHSVLVNMLGAATAAEAHAGEIGLSSMGRTLGELREPVVYPACADKIGALGPRLVEVVVGFYGNYEHLKYLGRVVFDGPDEAPNSRDLEWYGIRFEKACAHALTLFEELPIRSDPFDPSGLKAKVEGMAAARNALRASA